jgi:hypothetical protein
MISGEQSIIEKEKLVNIDSMISWL